MPTNSFSNRQRADNQAASLNPIAIIKPTISDPLVTLMLIGSLFCGIALGALLTVLGFFSLLSKGLQKLFGRGKKKTGIDFRWLLQ